MRASVAMKAAGDSNQATARSAQVKRWGAIGLLAALTAGYWFATRERVVPVGVVVPNVIAAPMSPLEASNFVNTVNAASQVELRGGVLTVSISAAIFPEQRTGQLALAQQYARADEIVQGKKRAIQFIDPNGNGFAAADPAKGVMMTR